MLKRSAAALLAVLLLAPALVQSKHHHHSSGHKHHSSKKTQVNTAVVETDVPQNVEQQISNAQVCSWYVDGAFYVLKPLILYTDNYNGTYATEKIEFNICNPVNNAPEGDACNGAFGCVTTIADLKREPLTGTDFRSSIIPDVDEYESRTGDTYKGGLTLTYQGSDQKCINGEPLKMKLQLLCDDGSNPDMYDNDVTDVEISAFDKDKCQYTAHMKSGHACYVFSLNSLFRYIGRFYYLFGGVMIVIGLIVGFLGKKLVKPTICIIGTCAFILLSSLLVFTLAFSRDSSAVLEWVVFGVCCLVGVLIGLLLAWLVRLGTAILAAWGGVCLALMLYTSFVYKIDNSQSVVFWVFVVLMGVVCGLLGFFLFNHAIIIATSIVGSYLFIRGISLYAGHFPNEMVIIQQIKNGQLADFDPAFYGYLAGFFVLSIIFIVFQYKFWFGKDKKHEHPYHRFRK